ncbi:hypothetical protein, partial [Pseudoalteromonas luteoviolacea]|uniref:hypothetical protein n=1 Tax=Pseudoalteromonas luteoviolacea TaxID=43657 RepID=UPI0019D33A21
HSSLRVLQLNLNPFSRYICLGGCVMNDMMSLAGVCIEKRAQKHSALESLHCELPCLQCKRD